MTTMMMKVWMTMTMAIEWKFLLLVLQLLFFVHIIFNKDFPTLVLSFRLQCWVMERNTSMLCRKVLIQ